MNFLNARQRSFIRSLYKNTNGCYATIAREFDAKFKEVCPPLRVLESVLLEEEKEEANDKIIRDVFLAQFSPQRRERRLSGNEHVFRQRQRSQDLATLSQFISNSNNRRQRAHSVTQLSLQSLRNAAKRLELNNRLVNCWFWGESRGNYRNILYPW